MWLYNVKNYSQCLAIDLHSLKVHDTVILGNDLPLGWASSADSLILLSTNVNAIQEMNTDHAQNDRKPKSNS